MKGSYLIAASLGVMGVFCLTTVAQSGSGATSLVEDPVYRKDCAKCHGKTADGRRFGGPALISAKVAGASAEDMRKMIADGKGRMPKFSGKLSSDQIVALVNEIEALNKK